MKDSKRIELLFFASIAMYVITFLQLVYLDYVLDLFLHPGFSYVVSKFITCLIIALYFLVVAFLATSKETPLEDIDHFNEF